eukprot:TRINITY_DN33511_c0_g1_i1.p1 TRINITY_DN33511_c0_g1~~TRINITY_DN33511_c0_g1_i1.p1  ORF type:complete len:778 (-),score=83.47 TRINITY_DN33511_c0_g1_i1:97-2430(-)
MQDVLMQRQATSQRATQVISATRLHFPADKSIIPQVTVGHLQTYAASIRELGIPCAVAVNTLQSDVERVMRETAPDIDMTVLHVPVWGAFVPALNTLLGEAQRRGARYILYQSLEVICSSPVLTRLLQHLTSDVLVVGPVLEGHTFSPGQQPLNGRTSPWNTLAVWSTRKLALTGFLSIADGLPQTASRLSRQVSGEDTALDSDTDFDIEEPKMGTEDWWNAQAGGQRGMARQPTETMGVPAGVEEVTAIAILQHLLGDCQARAVLLQLPDELKQQVSWKTDWGNDLRRKHWHEHKMASKVARPAAQIRQLFGSRATWKPSLGMPLLRRSNAVGSDTEGETKEETPELHFGVVLHFGESIRPPWQVECICLAAFALFFASFSSVFAAAFETINRYTNANVTMYLLAYEGILIGGIYIPMPLSLRLVRGLVSRGAGHINGLAFFLFAVLASNTLLVVSELIDNTGPLCDAVINLLSRLICGLGSGVLFQARFVLASLSTHDHHVDLQNRMFLASDFGLVIGALLPYISASLAGRDELPASMPELSPSLLLIALSLTLLFGLLLAFPRSLHKLPRSVRFPEGAFQSDDKKGSMESWQRQLLLFSGTARVFVQSAAVLALALEMRSAGMVRYFRQTKAVAGICMLPVTFTLGARILSARMPSFCRCGRAVAIFIASTVLIASQCAQFFNVEQSQPEYRLIVAYGELGSILVALAMATPQSVSRLYQSPDAEGTLVSLEWLKAYIGRLIGPVVALAIYICLGHDALVAVLCAGTILVALSA